MKHASRLVRYWVKTDLWASWRIFVPLQREVFGTHLRGLHYFMTMFWRVGSPESIAIGKREVPDLFLSCVRSFLAWGGKMLYLY